jgi:hypothetical protein
MPESLRDIFPEVECLEARVQETDISDGGVKRRPLTFSLDSAPRRVPCHGSDCASGEGFSLVGVIRGMVGKRETSRRGFAVCDAFGRPGRGICVNYFEYSIRIKYACTCRAAVRL